MGCDIRKHVSEVSDQVRLKPACRATVDSEILVRTLYIRIASKDMM